MTDFLAFSLNFPILDTVKSASLETKPRTADTPACPDLDCGRLAQLVRAPRLHRGGRGFKSLSAHFLPSLRASDNPEKPAFLLCFPGFSVGLPGVASDPPFLSISPSF